MPVNRGETFLGQSYVGIQVDGSASCRICTSGVTPLRKMDRDQLPAVPLLGRLVEFEQLDLRPAVGEIL